MCGLVLFVDGSFFVFYISLWTWGVDVGQLVAFRATGGAGPIIIHVLSTVETNDDVVRVFFYAKNYPIPHIHTN